MISYFLSNAHVTLWALYAIPYVWSRPIRVVRWDYFPDHRKWNRSKNGSYGEVNANLSIHMLVTLISSVVALSPCISYAPPLTTVSLLSLPQVVLAFYLHHWSHCVFISSPWCSSIIHCSLARTSRYIFYSNRSIIYDLEIVRHNLNVNEIDFSAFCYGLLFFQSFSIDGANSISIFLMRKEKYAYVTSRSHLRKARQVSGEQLVFWKGWEGVLPIW